MAWFACVVVIEAVAVRVAVSGPRRKSEELIGVNENLARL